MPPKKGKSSRSEESVASNVQDCQQLNGYFTNDFPIYCTQNGLPSIYVRNMDELDAPPPNAEYWVWYKLDSSLLDDTTKKLLKFSIRNLKITRSLMTALQSSLQSMNVTEISLWRTDIDVTNLSLLIDTIPQVQTKILDIGGSCLTDLNPIKRLMMNPEYKNLVSLSLRCCELTDQQLIPINEALKENVPLQQLDIGQNCISDTGIQLMADSLRMNRNLLSLVLSRNNITDIGVMYLAQVLKQFVLNHEEIVKRRKVFSSQYEDQWTALNESLSRRSSSRKSITKEKSPGLDSNRKPTAGPGALLKAASFIAKTKKGAEKKKATGKASASSEDKTAPTTPVHTATKPAVHQGPFVEGVKTNEESSRKEITCLGNYSLINLSLSYNQIGTTGVDMLLSVVVHQKDNCSDQGLGLQTISLQGNVFPTSYTNYIELQELLSSKFMLPLSPGTPTITDDALVTKT